MYPSDFRSSPQPIRLTLLAALCAVRAAEITDGLVDLLIALVLKIDEHGRMERVPYELCVLKALRDAIRRRELHVADSSRWRNPEDDLPADFGLNRDVHYDALRQPLDATAFVTELQRRHRAALSRLNDAPANGTAGGVRISNWRGEPVDHRAGDREAARAAHSPGPQGRGRAALGHDRPARVLKEAEYLTGFTEELSSVASREIVDRRELRARLLLMNFGLGTNMGIK